MVSEAQRRAMKVLQRPTETWSGVAGLGGAVALAVLAALVNLEIVTQDVIPSVAIPLLASQGAVPALVTRGVEHKLARESQLTEDMNEGAATQSGSSQREEGTSDDQSEDESPVEAEDAESPKGPKPTRRPTETGSAVAAALAAVLVAVLRIEDPEVIAALPVVLGAVPMGITWIVDPRERAAALEAENRTLREDVLPARGEVAKLEGQNVILREQLSRSGREWDRDGSLRIAAAGILGIGIGIGLSLGRGFSRRSHVAGQGLRLPRWRPQPS